MIPTIPGEDCQIMEPNRLAICCECKIIKCMYIIILSKCSPQQENVKVYVFYFPLAALSESTRPFQSSKYAYT